MRQPLAHARILPNGRRLLVEIPQRDKDISVSTGIAPSAPLTATGLPAGRPAAALFDPDVARAAANEAAAGHSNGATTDSPGELVPKPTTRRTQRIALQAARRPSRWTLVLRGLVLALIVVGMAVVAVRLSSTDAPIQGALIGQSAQAGSSTPTGSTNAAPAALVTDCPVIGFQPGGWSLWTKGSGLHQHVTFGEPSPFVAFNFSEDPTTRTTAVHWGLAEHTLATAVVQYIDAAGSCRMTAEVSNADTGADTIDIVVPAPSSAIQVAFIQVTDTVGD